MSRSSRRPSNKNNKKKTSASESPRPTIASRPWVHGDIDYGPALVAAHDLASWALDVAQHDVEGWPEGERRVANARRYVLARLRGKYARHVPVEDVIFAASLLARIFEEDLHLGMSDAVSVFDALELPTEVIPLQPRPSVPPVGRRDARSATVVVAAPSLRFCEECSVVHEPLHHVRRRNAA